MKPLTQNFAGALTQARLLKFMLEFVLHFSDFDNIFETETWYFWGNMKVLLGHLNWRLGTKDPHSDPADKTFLDLHIVSNVSKLSNLLLKMGLKLRSLAPVLKIFF